MKKIDDYSPAEMIALSDAEIEKIIKIHLADEGIKIPVPPYKPTPVKVAEPDKVVYQVAQLDIYFEDKSVADAIADTLVKNMDTLRKVDYSWDISSEAKYTKPLSDDYAYQNGITVSQKRVYSSELYGQIKKQLKENKAQAEEYKTLKDEYDKAEKATEKQTAYVMDKINEAKSFEANKKAKLRTFQEYLKLADNDKTVAWRFMEKAYTVTEEEKAYINANLNVPTADIQILQNFIQEDK